MWLCLTATKGAGPSPLPPPYRHQIGNIQESGPGYEELSKNAQAGCRPSAALARPTTHSLFPEACLCSFFFCSEPTKHFRDRLDGLHLSPCQKERWYTQYNFKTQSIHLETLLTCVPYWQFFCFSYFLFLLCPRFEQASKRIVLFVPCFCLSRSKRTQN